MLCSVLGNRNPDADHVKCSRGLHLVFVPRPYLCLLPGKPHDWNILVLLLVPEPYQLQATAKIFAKTNDAENSTNRLTFVHNMNLLQKTRSPHTSSNF